MVSEPYYVLYQKVPTYDHLQVFGSACFPYLRNYNTHKLSPKSALCIFLGYSTIHKGYHCMRLDDGRVFVSQHVKFDEARFPLSKKISPSPKSYTPSTTPCTITPPCPVPMASSSIYAPHDAHIYQHQHPLPVPQLSHLFLQKYQVRLVLHDIQWSPEIKMALANGKHILLHIILIRRMSWL